MLAETEKNNGLTQLMSKMLLQGTARRTAEQIALEVESIGGSIETFGGNNSFGLTTEVLSGDLKTGLDVFADVLLHPSFPAEAFERERRIQLETIRAQRDQLLQSLQPGHAPRAFWRRRLRSGSPRHRGKRQGRFPCPHWPLSTRAMVVPNNCVLAVFGDIHTAAAKAPIEKYFGRWKAGPPVIPTAAPALR